MSSVKPWSISTTVRNPTRLRDFLQVLAELAGKPFDASVQREYQIRLIQKRMYRPSNIPPEYQQYFENPDIEITYQVAEQVLDAQGYEDPSMRGRQSANPLNKLGFAIAVERLGNVKITPAGQMLLEHPEKASDLLFLSLLKLQYPNPISRDFPARKGFNIIPMLGCFALLAILEEEYGIDALHKDEFCLFVPTLIDASRVQEYAQRIAAFRNSTTQERKLLRLDWVREFYKQENLSESSLQYKNLYEYGDNAMRYFRFTRYLQVISDPLRGDWQIRIEPSRKTEVKMLLAAFSPDARPFNSLQDYLDYLGNPEEPVLPWKQLDSLKEVAYSLRRALRDIHTALQLKPTDLFEVDFDELSAAQLEQIIVQMREELRRLSLLEQQERLRLSVDSLIQHASVIEKLNKQKGIQPEDFEHLLFKILSAINDEELIQPNYPTDDYGNPISHAPGGKADIECFYKAFAMIVEVTLDTGNFQWVREGQPVMRHLREFEERVGTDLVYCLFIAPKVHQDTYSQFWFSVKYEYQGKPQRILPLTTAQFRRVVDVLRERIAKHGSADHLLLMRLIDAATAVNHLNGYHEWRQHIQGVLDQWATEVAGE
ncbi:MAG: AlwI family type II restriction endonuclease [Fimbriimonadales bacterium]|nr:AlwI family type II restriction endonuclease [Fimbriimonadales bacterium]